MGIATDMSPAQPSGSQPYTRWEIDARLFDERMQEIDRFTCRQDLLIGPEEFVVRLTRLDAAGRDGRYEDRGSLYDSTVIQGVTGFGGRLDGRLLKNGGVFLEGKGGDVDFILVATPTGPDHFRCFRRFEVKQPTIVWGKRVNAGTYFATTEDQLIEVAPQAPAEVLEPLSMLRETA